MKNNRLIADQPSILSIIISIHMIFCFLLIQTDVPVISRVVSVEEDEEDEEGFED